MIATTIIIIGETIPALTAASPNIKDPTIDYLMSKKKIHDKVKERHSCMEKITSLVYTN